MKRSMLYKKLEFKKPRTCLEIYAMVTQTKAILQKPVSLDLVVIKTYKNKTVWKDERLSDQDF